MDDKSVKVKILALLLPANCSELKLVGYDCMDREDGETNIDAEFRIEDRGWGTLTAQSNLLSSFDM